MARTLLTVEINDEIVMVNKVSISIDGQEYRITADPEGGLRINKYPDSINIQPKVSNDIRIY